MTEEWREHNAGDWQRIALGSVVTDLRYGTAQKSTYEAVDGTPVLRIPNIGDDGKIDPSDLKYSNFEHNELANLALKAGDLLIIRSNGSVDLVGKAATVPQEIAGYAFAGYLIRVRLDTTAIVPEFLYLSLASPRMRQTIELKARSTSGVNNINSHELRALTIDLPSLPEQHEIVCRVQALFACADPLEAHYESAREQVEQLTPSLLAKAFRGELVAQE